MKADNSSSLCLQLYKHTSPPPPPGDREVCPKCCNRLVAKKEPDQHSPFFCPSHSQAHLQLLNLDFLSELISGPRSDYRGTEYKVNNPKVEKRVAQIIDNMHFLTFASPSPLTKHANGLARG